MATFTVRQVLKLIPDAFSRRVQDTLWTYLTGRLHSVSLNNATLAIKIGGSALAKSTATWYGFIGGQLVTKAASDMAALSGTVTNAKFNVFVFFIDQSGTLTTLMGTEAATLGGVKFPERPSLNAAIGFVIINPTGTGNFVGGTTALDDATVVPNAAYQYFIGASDPNLLMS